MDAGRNLVAVGYPALVSAFFLEVARLLRGGGMPGEALAVLG
jgi:hypothetical protein